MAKTASAGAMKSLVACVALVVLCALAAAPAAMAQSCDTGSNSPTQGDANSCVQFVRNKGNTQCCQTSSSGCTNMCFAGTAAVDICGSQGTCTTCVAAGDNLNRILATCVSNIGGTARVSGSIGSNPSFRIRRA